MTTKIYYIITSFIFITSVQLLFSSTNGKSNFAYEVVSESGYVIDGYKFTFEDKLNLPSLDYKTGKFSETIRKAQLDNNLFQIILESEFYYIYSLFEFKDGNWKTICVINFDIPNTGLYKGSGVGRIDDYRIDFDFIAPRIFRVNFHPKKGIPYRFLSEVYINSKCLIETSDDTIKQVN